MKEKRYRSSSRYSRFDKENHTTVKTCFLYSLCTTCPVQVYKCTVTTDSLATHKQQQKESSRQGTAMEKRDTLKEYSRSSFADMTVPRQPCSAYLVMKRASLHAPFAGLPLLLGPADIVG